MTGENTIRTACQNQSRFVRTTMRKINVFDGCGVCNQRCLHLDYAIL